MKISSVIAGLLALVASSTAFSAPLITLHMGNPGINLASGATLGVIGTLVAVMAFRIHREKARQK